jgi:UDP-N-acetylglucosamine:LPS N-acetylglucosamine transferase
MLVNFGGLSSRLLAADTAVRYADVMTRCAVAAMDQWPGRIVVAAGEHVIEHIDRRLLREMHPRAEVVNLSHDLYMAVLARSRALISSAGMHAIYEACAATVPFVCLPSQNLSGALAVKALERDGMASVLDWNHLYGLEGLEATTEADACRRIEEQIARFDHDLAAQERLIRHLRSALSSDNLFEVRQRQTRFYELLGEPGAERIATRIMRLLRSGATGSRADVVLATTN